jgi:hypothetical protein
LKHRPGSREEADFIDGARKLAAIPGVQKFESLRQTGRKNSYTFGLSMEFANQAAYDGYNSHPDHVRFVEERWTKEVDDFLEIDYMPL